MSSIPGPGHPGMLKAAGLSGHHSQTPAEASPRYFSSESCSSGSQARSFYWKSCSSCFAGTQTEVEPGNASLVLGLARQAALRSVPLCSPFVGFLADRVPVDLETEEEVCMSATHYWKWAARPLAGRLCEEAVPRPPQLLELNSGNSSGFPLGHCGSP